MSGRLLASAAAVCVLLSGCGQHGEGDQPLAASASENGGSTVAAAVAGSADHRKLAAALADTQLAPVLDGKADYTLLAPSDAAFMALGDKAGALTAQDRRPLMIAVLRGHILPGQVTPQSVEAAIARNRGPVEMRTMAGTMVSFARSGEGLTVRNAAGTATLAKGASAASNGAVLPIDKVLLPPS